MDQEIPVNYKVYLCAAGYEPEIRRITIDQDISRNYFYLKQKLVSIFPALKNTQFTVSWKDREGDTVRICTDEELTIALIEMDSQDFKKIYVSSTPQHDNEGPIHPNVLCNNCGQAIQGFRYKCIVCVDVDLCPDCERAQNHPDHPVIRIPLPVNIEEPQCRRFFHKISKKVEDLYQACERSEKKGRGEGKRDKRCQRSSCPVMNPSEDPIAQFFNYLCVPNPNPQSGATGANQEATPPASGPQGESTNPSNRFFQALSEQDPLQFCQVIRQGLSSFLDPLGCPEYAAPTNTSDGAGRESTAGAGVASSQSQPSQSQVPQPQTHPSQSQEPQPQTSPAQSQGPQPQPQSSQSQEDQPQPPQGQEQAPENQPGASQSQPQEQVSQAQPVPPETQAEATSAQPLPSDQPQQTDTQPAQTRSEGTQEKLHPNTTIVQEASHVQPQALPAQSQAQPPLMHPSEVPIFQTHPQRIQTVGRPLDLIYPVLQPHPAQVQPLHPQTTIQTHSQSYSTHPFFAQAQQQAYPASPYFPPAHIYSTQAHFPTQPQPQPQPPIPQQVITENAGRSRTLDNTFMNLHLNSEIRSRSPQPYRLLKKGSREESPVLDNTWTVLQKPEQGAGDSAEAAAEAVAETVTDAVPKPIVDEVPVKAVTGKSTVEETLARLTAMGFTNDEDWLKELVENKNCDLNEVLQFLMPIPKPQPLE